MEQIKKQALQAVMELQEIAALRVGQILVVGCSSSEVGGGMIGHQSSEELAVAILDGLYPFLQEQGIALAAQCCEHLNRAIIVERAVAEQYGLEEVCVVPLPKAGGSFATAAYARFADPVAVEHIAAHAGLDIGDTFIGMHLRHVAVPVRLSIDTIGHAHLTAARTRPKLIGGPRAFYGEDIR